MPKRDRPGPHPENQRKRRELRGPRHALIGLLAAAAVCAIVLGLRRVVVHDGDRPTGLLLALLIGGTQALAALLLVIHHVRARAIALIAALVAIGWGLGHMMVSDWSWFQIAVFGVGALEVLLVAGCTPRDAGKRPKKQRGTSRRF